MYVVNNTVYLFDLFVDSAEKTGHVEEVLAAKWDGIHDKETGLLGYSWTVGTKVCEELIDPHHDPHKHLFDRSQWTNSGQIYPLPAPYITLPDGRYYITVRALNNVQYGGPLATTICHTTPYIVDTSPPFVHEIFNIKYNEETFLIYAEHNTSDPESGIAQLDLCLGQSTRDCNMMEWQRYPYGSNITHTFEIPNGIPAWVKVRAINNGMWSFDLRTVGHADQAIIVDITSPEAGTVYDGPVYKTDLMFTKDKDQICTNWLNFFDPESGIGKYAIGVGTKPGLRDITDLILAEEYVHEACLDLQHDKQLQHGHKYFTVVWAYNMAIKQRNISAESNGVIVDLTKPEVGEVVDGNWTEFKDVQFSSSKSTVDLQWQGFYDPESHIRQYDVQILRLLHDSSEWEVLKNWTTFENDTSSASWKNFHLNHKDRVKSTVRAINGAINPVERDTDGFIVDLTPPTLLYLGDGTSDKSDIEFQVNNSTLSVNFKFVDEESGLNHYKIQVYEVKESSRHQVYPAQDGSWVELKNDTSITSYTQTGLHLSAGVRYSLRVGAVNQAGFIAAFDTNGVIVDNTPPIIYWLHVGVMAGEDEDVDVDGFVYQSDHIGIKISWFTLDHESGIEGAMVAVGTEKGQSSILDWTYLVGDLKDYYIENLNLQTTNETVKSPVYYVSVKTKNGAEQYSSMEISHPIIVLPEDVTGIVTDGPSFGIEYDIDYQSDMSTITVAFSGFESSQHGIMDFEWAIGTVAGEEDIQPFMGTGIVHTEMDVVAGNGVASSGFAQTVVSLEHGSQYYTSIRAVTNAGKILEAMTDGVMVDVTPPKITVDSLADVEFNGSDSGQVLTLYQSSTDSLTARWHYSDSEILENRVLDNIDDAWFSVGTYPFGDDIWNVTDMAISTNLYTSLPVGMIHPGFSGKPNLLSIWARNAAGLTGKIVSTSVVVDQTPPINGQVNCPSFAKQHIPIKCSWSGFFDKESPITMYTISMGTKEGLNDVVSPIEISGDMDEYAFKDMKSEVKHGDTYYATVTATNKVGLQSYSFSASIRVDTTPPVSGQVVELYDEYRVNTMNDTATILMNMRACKTSSECSAIDATCQESFTTVSVAWQPFLDPESGIVQYEIAVGTSHCGAQIKPFFEIPLGVNNYIIHGLNLKGMKQVFVTVKGINGAGMSTVSTSNGIYLSYLSQGEKPPKLGGVWDDDPHSYADIDYQTDRTTLYARWDVSGDPCPAVKYEWAIERIDGYRVQDFVDTFGTTHGVNDQMQMKNGERYYSLLRVTNALGYQYTIRSDGVTIHEHQLVPGQVYDGDVFGYDLNSMKTKSKATTNWEGFGVPRDAIKKVDILTGNAGVQVDDITPSKDQEVEYYEVALGTDRRFKKTRDDVVPFTKVGRNTSVTFWDLNLVPGFAMYYFTVRAYSASYSMSEVTSNGFYVAFDGGVTAGKIVMPDFVPTNEYLDVNWKGFTSKVDILMYYVALSNHSLANGTSCKRYIDGGRATEEEKNKLFNLFGVANVGTNTMYRFSNIHLEQGTTYFGWVMGADKAGECNMTVHPVTIDVTPPGMGKIRQGPFFDMPMSYTMSNSSIHAYWQGFDDKESSIDHYEISVWQNSTCNRQTSTQILLIPEIKLSSNYTDYAFVELNLMHSVPYIIKLTAVNKAGLSVKIQTTPILHDASEPIPGHVGEGSDFVKDVVWWGSDMEVSGTLLQLQNPNGPSCPCRHISFKDEMIWKALNLYGFRDNSGIDWNIQYREANILINNLTDEMTIKLARDTKTEHMYSGGYFGSADMENGGDYELSIKAADGDGKAVTEVMFWDGDMSLLDTFHFMEEPDWTADVCSCCFNNPVLSNCTCNCSSFLETKAYYANLTYHLTGEDRTTAPTITVATTTGTRSTVPWTNLDDKLKQQLKHNNTNINIPSHVTQRACGFQIYTGADPYSVVWCQFYNDSSYPLSLKTTMPFNPAEDFHQYKISFFTVEEELMASWCLYVYADDQTLSQLCGIPQFTTDTKLLLHVWNKDNFLPAVDDLFKIWTVRASFRDLILPPKVGALCRYGEPFRAGTNPVVRYEAGIGTQKGVADFADFREILSPCLPCLDTCSHYVCDSACEDNTDTLLHFTLKDLYLEPEVNVDTENGTDIVPAIYYITVRAVLGSGATATASSNGFYVDLTPPVFDPDVMLYIDVRQGEFTPTHFQSSNDTIKSVWLCRDNHSDIEEYHWAIGITPGGTEVQSFISTGINPTGINSNLSGILEHNTTYYVSVKCRNQAGITTVWNDTKGVTVLLEAPDVEKGNASIEGAKQFDHPVEPKDAMTTSDPTTIGGSWEVSPDPSVTRYDYCVGSSRDVINDIFPCTWVGLNISGTVAIKGGNLTIAGVPVRRLSELKPLGNDFNDTKYKTDAENIFHMEPGRTMFITMRLCNEATLCKNKFLGSVVVQTPNMKVATSTDGSPIDVKLDAIRAKKFRRSVDVIDIQTPSGLDPGQSLITAVLENNDLTTQYRSDASMDFVPYIVNPNDTLDLVERKLARRRKEIYTVFTVVPVGHMSLPGPLLITFDNSNANASGDDTVITLLHWNPDAQKWQISSGSCQDVNETEIRDSISGKASVKVCDTRSHDKNVTKTRFRRNAAHTDHGMFSRETMFATARVKDGIVNSPPVLNCITHFILKEDQGVLYDLEANDPEGDKVIYEISPSHLPVPGEVLITPDGRFTYTPCKDCSGNITFGVILEDDPSGADIPSASSTALLTVEVEEENDPPTVFLYDAYGQNMLNRDPTEPKFYEQLKLNESYSFTAVYGAFDMDYGDSLTLHRNSSAHGNFSIDILLANFTDKFKTCDAAVEPMCPDVNSALDRSRMTWMAVNITYHLDSPYIGLDNLTFVVTDKSSTKSDIVTLQMALMAQPCFHNGGCKSKHPDIYQCEDIRRTEDFDQYYSCDCNGGWTGLRCEDDIDECVGNPCAEPLICLNLQNHFQCACPPNQTNCLPVPKDGFKWWMGALIAVGCLLLIGIVVVCFLYKTGHLMAWKRSAYNAMARIKNRSKVSIMSDESDDSVSKSEDKVEENEEDKVESNEVEEENGSTSVLEVSGVDISADTPKLDFGFAPGVFSPPHHRIKTRTTHT